MKDDTQSKAEQVHEPVLIEEILTLLAPVKPSSIFFDGTAGGGGHLLAYAKRFPDSLVYGIDADGEAVKRVRSRILREGVEAVVDKANFKDLDHATGVFGISEVDRVLLDLGWGAHHLVSGRGFSFEAHEPLLMTYEDQVEKVLTASDLVNKLDENQLADIIYHYGEERGARKIARAIVEAREKGDIEYSDELGEVIEKAMPRRGKIHPATKTFQALRIAVNDELGVLREGIKKAVSLFAPGGRLAIISFHSIEDRIVKNQFRNLSESGEVAVLTKKPTVATSEEIQTNRRARSAKLRVIEKK